MVEPLLRVVVEDKEFEAWKFSTTTSCLPTSSTPLSSLPPILLLLLLLLLFSEDKLPPSCPPVMIDIILEARKKIKRGSLDNYIYIYI